MYRRIWLASMRDLPLVNLALSVEAIGFRRWLAAASTGRADGDAPARSADSWQCGSDGMLGDWVGAMITPWFINLLILPGGGDLWSDRPSGQRCHIVFPVGPLEFIADDDASAEVPAFRYCPLFAPPGPVRLAGGGSCRGDSRAECDVRHARGGEEEERATSAAAAAPKLLLPARPQLPATRRQALSDLPTRRPAPGRSDPGSRENLLRKATQRRHPCLSLSC